MMFHRNRKMFTQVAAISVCSLTLTACNSTSTESVTLHSTIDQVQPMTGLVLWSDNSKLATDVSDAIRVEFSYLTYADVVSQDGLFSWQRVDDILTTAASRGHHVILRFHDTYPGVTTPSVPSLVTQEAGYHHTEVLVEGLPTFIPDWSSQPLEDFLISFLEAFAQRYNQDKRLLLLQLGFGSYAEYHLFEGPFQLGETFPSMAFQERFISRANDLFTQLQWAVSIDAANADYSPLGTQSAAQSYNFGLFDDSLMHETHSEGDSEYNRQSWLTFGSQSFQNRIMGGELNYYSDWDQENALALPDGPWGTPFEWFAEEYHLSYVIANDQPQYQDTARLKQASMALGYRFNITALTCSETTCIVTVSNSGNAPIYYDAFVCLNDVCSQQSLRQLQPGESLAMKLNDVTLPFKVTISSPHLLEGQMIQFNADIE